MRFFILMAVLLATYNATAAVPPVCLDIFTQQAPTYEDTEWSEAFGTRMLTIYDAEGKTIGTTEYSVGETAAIAADRTTLSPFTIMEAPYRTQAMYEVMVRQLLELYPETQFIVADLPAEQVAAFNKAWDQTKNDNSALKETPFYKVYSKFGFTEILSITDDLKGNVIVYLAKPSPIQRKIPHPKPPRYWDVIFS